MAILNQFASAMKEGSTLQIQMKRTATGTELTFIPIVEGVDADTEDQAMATFQAAATRPFAMTVPKEEVIDDALTAHIQGITLVHAAGSEALSNYRERVEATVKVAKEREQAAKEAKEKKAADDLAKKKADKVAKQVGKKNPGKEAASQPAPEKAKAVDALDLFNSVAQSEAPIAPASSNEDGGQARADGAESAQTIADSTAVENVSQDDHDAQGEEE